MGQEKLARLRSEISPQFCSRWWALTPSSCRRRGALERCHGALALSWLALLCGNHTEPGFSFKASVLFTHGLPVPSLSPFLPTLLQHQGALSLSLFFFLSMPVTYRKFLGWGSNPHYSSDQSHSSDNTGSLTHRATRELPNTRALS